MAVSVQSVTTIEAGIPEIMAVLADVESLVDWSEAHRAVEVREADDEGWPIVVWEKISQYGMTEEMVVRYEWYDGEVSWSLVESGSQKVQNARSHTTIGHPSSSASLTSTARWALDQSTRDSTSARTSMISGTPVSIFTTDCTDTAMAGKLPARAHPGRKIGT